MLAWAPGCSRKGLEVLRPPLPAMQRLPALAVVEPAQLTRYDFALDPETRYFRPTAHPIRLDWLTGPRLTELCRRYVAQAGLFQDVAAEAPRDRSRLHLVCRPRVTLRQYVRLSLSGTMLTLGTGFFYAVLGGSANYRYVDMDLAVDVLSPTGRLIETYHSGSRCPEKAVTESEEQLGPMIGYALTRTLEEVTSRISADNDVLLRALSADLAAKGLTRVAEGHGMQLHVTRPGQVILSEQSAEVSGNVSGVDRPIRLAWKLNGMSAGPVPLIDTSAPSVKRFEFTAHLRKGAGKIELVLSDAGPPDRAELARKEIGYLCVGETPLSDIRKRWAVVIGISRYAHAEPDLPQLKYAARDAQAFAEFLRSDLSGGYDPNRTLCLFDEHATVRNVRGALFEFLSRAEENDLVVIFFSGHGMRQGQSDNFFMLCHDTQPDHMPSTAFPMWDIDMALRRYVKARRVVVLADACHAGAIAPEGARAGGQNPVHQYLRQLALAEAGRLVFTASEARELSHESEDYGGGHGVFTYYLLEGLKGAADADANGIVDAGEIVEYVRAKVKAATKDRQHPDSAGQYDRRLPLAVLKEGK